MKLTLWILISIGLFGAFQISYTTFTSDNDCPQLVGIYICYGVLVSYAAMIVAQLNLGKWKARLFYTGWIFALLAAATGSILEKINGKTCPKSESDIPMCYVSLALVLMILFLFYMLSRNVDERQKLH